MFAIMSEGRMRQSTVNIKQNKIGVYATTLENWKTALSYAIAVPLDNNGIFYQFVLELVAPVETVVHNRHMGSDHVLMEQSLRINGVRIYVKHSRTWIAGTDVFHARHAWEKFLEFRPAIPREENRVPIQSKGVEGVIKEVNEFMQNLRIPLVSAEISCEECAAAELIEFDALSDDQDIRPINEELVNEMFTHLVSNPYGRWKYDHSAPTLMVLMARHQLHKAMRKVRQAMWGQTKEQSYARIAHKKRAGYNPRQDYSPVPPRWLKGKFGFFAIPNEECKLTPALTDSAAKTQRQWKQLTQLAFSRDIINYWIGKCRLDHIDPEDDASMTNQILIC